MASQNEKGISIKKKTMKWISNIIKTQSFKSAMHLTLYTIKLSIYIFLIPILISSAACVVNIYIGLFLILLIILFIKPVTYKIIIPAVKIEMKKRNQNHKV